MTITGTTLLKAFYHITVAIYVLGAVEYMLDNAFDINLLWFITVLLIGSFLIEKRRLTS